MLKGARSAIREWLEGGKGKYNYIAISKIKEKMEKVPPLVMDIPSVTYFSN